MVNKTRPLALQSEQNQGAATLRVGKQKKIRPETTQSVQLSSAVSFEAGTHFGLQNG
jgi:hypothetical protein